MFRFQFELITQLFHSASTKIKISEGICVRLIAMNDTSGINITGDIGQVFGTNGNAKDVIGYMHHNISQHTKEISVINTMLADIMKANHFEELKALLDEYISSNNSRVEKVSTSIKLLTKQVFHNDTEVSNVREYVDTKIAETNEKLLSLIDNINNTLDKIQQNQDTMSKRLSAIENGNTYSGKRAFTCSNQNVEIVNIAPTNEIRSDEKSNKPQQTQESMEAMLKIADMFHEQAEEIEELQHITTENIRRMTMFIQFSEDSMNELGTQIAQTQEGCNHEFQSIADALQSYCTKEDLQIAIQKLRGSVKDFNGRPRTSFSGQRGDGERIPTTVSVTMISGDNLTRPSTTQNGRVQVRPKNPNMRTGKR